MKRFDRYRFPEYPDVDVSTSLDDKGIHIRIESPNPDHAQAVAALIEKLPGVWDADKTITMSDGECSDDHPSQPHHWALKDGKVVCALSK